MANKGTRVRIAWLLRLCVQIATLQSASSNYYTYSPKFQDFSFPKSLEVPKNPNNDQRLAKCFQGSLNLLVIKNSCILFSSIQIDGKYLSFNHRVFHQVFWSLLGTSTRLGKLSCLLTSMHFQGWWMIESKAMNKKLKREIREFGKRREKETKKQKAFR